MTEFFHTTPAWQLALYGAGILGAGFAIFAAFANGIPQYLAKQAGLDPGSPDDQG